MEALDDRTKRERESEICSSSSFSLCDEDSLVPDAETHMVRPTPECLFVDSSRM